MIIRTRKSSIERGAAALVAWPLLMRLPRLLLATGQPTAIDYSSIMLLTRGTQRGHLRFNISGFDPLPPASQTGSWAANPRGWQPYFWRPIGQAMVLRSQGRRSRSLIEGWHCGFRRFVQPTSRRESRGPGVRSSSLG